MQQIPAKKDDVRSQSIEKPTPIEIGETFSMVYFDSERGANTLSYFQFGVKCDYILKNSA